MEGPKKPHSAEIINLAERKRALEERKEAADDSGQHAYLSEAFEKGFTKPGVAERFPNLDPELVMRVHEDALKEAHMEDPAYFTECQTGAGSMADGSLAAAIQYADKAGVNAGMGFQTLAYVLELYNRLDRIRPGS